MPCCSRRESARLLFFSVSKVQTRTLIPGSCPPLCFRGKHSLGSLPSFGLRLVSLSSHFVESSCSSQLRRAAIASLNAHRRPGCGPNDPSINRYVRLATPHRPKHRRRCRLPRIMRQQTSTQRTCLLCHSQCIRRLPEVSRC